ncbi:hypothetical protein MHBO_000844 [Bonamia ostreae]|uniref:Uncharacterized protein n=1 Tax=Bonamia ostreae TaxID=126728 RepID=A0ABV2AH20_9EUKA
MEPKMRKKFKSTENLKLEETENLKQIKNLKENKEVRKRRGLSDITNKKNFKNLQQTKKPKTSKEKIKIANVKKSRYENESSKSDFSDVEFVYPLEKAGKDKIVKDIFETIVEKITIAKEKIDKLDSPENFTELKIKPDKNREIEEDLAKMSNYKIESNLSFETILSQIAEDCIEN